MSKNRKDPCKPYACRIQACLNGKYFHQQSYAIRMHTRSTCSNCIWTSYLFLFAENNFQEDKCVDVLEEMRICCLKWHKESLCCSGIDLEKSFLKKQTAINQPNYQNRCCEHISFFKSKFNIIFY